MECSDIAIVKPLALSLTEQSVKDRKLLGRPITTLARMAGLTVNDVFDKLTPELEKNDLEQTIRYAEVGLSYIAVIDRNRARQEIGQEFIRCMDLIIKRVNDGLNSKEHWIKRKAMKLHAYLMDEAGEKKRFVESVLVDDAYKRIQESKENIDKLEKEILNFEMNNTTGVFEATVIPNNEQLHKSQ
jgi:hypothetical protein